MSTFTNFILSVEKGLCGNIGKITHLHSKDSTPFVDVMLFLTATNMNEVNADKQPTTQIVHAYFSQMPFIGADQYKVGDFVRVHFERIDLSKGISDLSGKEVMSIRVKANAIELLRKASKKITP